MNPDDENAGGFEDLDVMLQTVEGPVPLRIKAYVLHALWCAGSGPQTAHGLYVADFSLLEDMAKEKLAAGLIEDGGVVIRDVDIDV